MAFFSRLEERKGIKVFVDALHKLDWAALAVSQVRLTPSALMESMRVSRVSHLLRPGWHPTLATTCGTFAVATRLAPCEKVYKEGDGL